MTLQARINPGPRPLRSKRSRKKNHPEADSLPDDYVWSGREDLNLRPHGPEPSEANLVPETSFVPSWPTLGVWDRTSLEVCGSGVSFHLGWIGIRADSLTVPITLLWALYTRRKYTRLLMSCQLNGLLGFRSGRISQTTIGSVSACSPTTGWGINAGSGL